MTVDDLLTNGGKEQVAAGMASIGKACPDFSRTKIEFDPIDEDDS